MSCTDTMRGQFSLGPDWAANLCSRRFYVTTAGVRRHTFHHVALWLLPSNKVTQMGRLSLICIFHTGFWTCVSNQWSLVIAVVVVIVPVAVRVPTVLVFIPPTMALVPAAFAGLV